MKTETDKLEEEYEEIMDLIDKLIKEPTKEIIEKYKNHFPDFKFGTDEELLEELRKHREKCKGESND